MRILDHAHLAAESRMTARSRAKRALVVDDDPAMARALGRHLQSLAWTYTIADGACAAIRALEEGPHWDVLLTDLNMPHMSGTELARLARRRWPHLWIVLCSGSFEPAAFELAGSGVDARLGKPILVDALATALGAVKVVEA